MTIKEAKEIAIPILNNHIKIYEVPDKIKALKISCKEIVLFYRDFEMQCASIEMCIEAAYKIGLEQHKLN